MPDPRRQAADVGAAVELVQGGSGVPLARRASKLTSSGNSSRTKQLQQPEEAVRVVFERRRAQEQDVAARARRSARSPASRLAGMTRRAAQSLCLVHDEQIDAARDRLLGQLRALDQHLERDHRAAMHVERVEVGTEVARDVGQARRIEQREHLVVLAPQLAQPLDGQRLGRDHQAALDLPGVHEPIQDQRGLDGLAEADFVGEQPAHRIAGARALRDVELVRKQPDASAEERAQAVGFAKSQEVQDVQAGHEVLDVVEIAQGEALEERAFELQRPQRVGRRRAPVRQPQRPVRESRRDRRFLAGRGDADRPPRAQIDRDQRVRVGRQPQRRPRARELDDQRAASRPVTRPIPSSGLKR